MRRAARIDANQPEIVQALQDVGAVVIDCHTLENAFDIMVAFRGNLYIAEIKNPEYRPKHGDDTKMLTKGEMNCNLLLQTVGIDYNIIFTIDEALEMIGAVFYG
jgi:hypothetical protein